MVDSPSSKRVQVPPAPTKPPFLIPIQRAMLRRAEDGETWVFDGRQSLRCKYHLLELRRMGLFAVLGIDAVSGSQIYGIKKED